MTRRTSRAEAAAQLSGNAAAFHSLAHDATTLADEIEALGTPAPWLRNFAADCAARAQDVEQLASGRGPSTTPTAQPKRHPFGGLRRFFTRMRVEFEKLWWYVRG